MVDLSTVGLLLAFASAYHGPVTETPRLIHVRYFLKGQEQQPPVKDIYITVSAPRLKHAATDTGAGTKKSAEDIKKFGGGGGGDVKNVTKSEAGVASDSSGQIHVRGEHTDITYVVDGTPLPDTLSGRQGAVVVPATVENLDIILGGFAPEYGIQTAAVLDITTFGRAQKESSDLSLGYGDHGVRNAQLTSLSPLGSKLSYVLNIGHDESSITSEAQQPDNQEAHNHGENENFYTKFIYQSNARDRLSLTLSANPSQSQIGNRTGLSNQYYGFGQGYGFLGNRNADGTMPNPDGSLGSATLPLKSQEAEGMDINDREVNNYALLDWRHTFDSRSTGLLSLTLLHAGQDVTNNNSGVDVTNLPVDDSIEFNPTSSRNVHHAQVNGNYTNRSGSHTLKAGFIYDKQTGQESYQIIPHSQLALDGLFATAPGLAPTGHVTGATDIYGNPVYVATSNNTPTLYVARNGYYAGAYVQDTWKNSRRLTINYGLRADHYNQSESLSATPVDLALISPRLNLSYVLDPKTVLRASYDKLFNTPPLAQGAILGQPLQPEVLDQYDIGIEKQVTPLQTLKLAYYAKQILNQVDVGLLLPGSEIGLYTGVNFERSGIHGIEFSYEFNAPKGVGWDGYFNYTYSQASPNGNDNTGAPAPDFNDHDQRQMVGAGLSYTLASGASAALTVTHGSGLDSSVVPPSDDRTPRTEVSMHLDTGDHLFSGRGGISMDITNLLDDRTVINFQSGFSGTRFQTGRMIALTAHYKF